MKKPDGNSFKIFVIQEKTQARIQSLVNSFGDKITKPMEMANLLNYRFSTLGEFIGLQQTNNIPPKFAPRKCFNFRYITTKETNVLIDHYVISLINSLQNDHYVISLINSLQKEIFQKILKKLVLLHSSNKENPEDPLNYRPISVTSALSKVFEKAFSSQVS